MPLQNIRHTVDRIPFADPARVHFHSGPVEADGLRRRVQGQVPVAHLGEGRRHFGSMGQVAGALVKSPHLHQRPHRNVERPFALPAVFHAGRQEPEQFRRNLNGPGRRVPVNQAPLAFGFVIRKLVVEPPGLIESGIHRRLHAHPVVSVQRDGVGRTHGVGAFFEPQELLSGSGRNRQQKQNYHNLFDFRANFGCGHEIFSPVSAGCPPVLRHSGSCRSQTAAPEYA